MQGTVLALALAPATVSLAPLHATPSAQTLTRQELAQVTTWRRNIHQHPELSDRETRTSALVATQLKKLGLEVHTGIADTGVVALLQGSLPGPRLASRADMDALPVTEEVALPFASKAHGTYRSKTVGVMHACGHDAHTAMLLGIATALAGMRKDLHGSVLFVFQPTEEGAPEGEEGGASLMLKDGVFKDFKPDAMFGMRVVSRLNGSTVETEMPVGDSNPVLVNDPALTARVKASVIRAIGAGHVIEAKPWMASEDFAYFAQQVPSVFFFVGATSQGQDAATAPSNHSPKFFLDEGALQIGMESMLQATLDYLNTPKA